MSGAREGLRAGLRAGAEAAAIAGIGAGIGAQMGAGIGGGTGAGMAAAGGGDGNGNGNGSDFGPKMMINIRDLDLTKSYAPSSTRPSSVVRPARQQRWQHSGPQPLQDWALLPAGWNDQEPDLDPRDIDAQITRCQERIADNIMPHIFENRLEGLKAAKDAWAAEEQGEPPGLGQNIYRRLSLLKKLVADLQATGDRYGQIVNANAIMNAYRAGTLRDWPGLITYWSNGQRLCEPRPFDWDEFEAINRANNGDMSFFTEGYRGPSWTTMSPSLTVDEQSNGMFYYKIALKNPMTDWWTELEFLYDTGATSMMIYEGDIPQIFGPRQPGTVLEPLVVGAKTFEGLGGRIVCNEIELEATLLDGEGKRLTPWTRLAVAMHRGTYVPGHGIPRLDGTLMRELLYCCTSPTKPQMSLSFLTRKRTLWKVPHAPEQKIRYKKEGQAELGPQARPTITAGDNTSAGTRPAPPAANSVPEHAFDGPGTASKRPRLSYTRTAA